MTRPTHEEIYVLDRQGTLKWGGNERVHPHAQGQHVTALFGWPSGQWDQATEAAVRDGHVILETEGPNRDGAWHLIDLGMTTGWLLQWAPGRGAPLTLANRMLQLERLRVAMDEHAIVAITDRAGVITYANERFCQVSGYACTELLGQTHRLINSGYHPAEFFRALWATIRRGQTWRGEICNRRKDGALYWVSTSIIPICDPRGQPLEYISLRTDITHQKVAERERLHLLQRTEENQRQESLAQMATGVAHDFNNLLTGILGAVELAAETPGRDRGDYLDQIRSSALRAAEMCRVLLDYSGRGSRVPQPLDLGELLAGSQPFLKASARHRVPVSFGPKPPQPVVVIADATQLRQVLLNLVVNATDAMAGRPGEVTVALGSEELTAEKIATADVAASNATPGRYGSIEVRDLGCGIPPENRRKLFDPFFTTKTNGRGIGLATVAGIVRSNGGLLFVESETGHGSVFRLLLPARRLMVERVEPATSGLWHGSGRLLLQDADELAREVTAVMLQHLGFQVDATPDRASTLARFSQNPHAYRGAVIDITAPEHAGLVLAGELAALTPELPILLISGAASPERPRHAAILRQSFLSKPFLVSELATALHALIEDGVTAVVAPPPEPDLPPPVELHPDLEMLPAQAAALEMHSVLNLLNVLSGECQLLRSAVPDLAPLAIDFEHEARLIEQHGWNEGHCSERLRAVEKELLRHLGEVGNHPAARLATTQDSLECLRRAAQMLIDRRVELESRMNAPVAWSPVPVTELARGLTRLLDTVALVSHGKYRIVYGAEAKGPLDYLVTIDFAGLDGAKSVRIPLPLNDALRDLVLNSRKYTPPGGLIWVRLRETATELVLTVTDTGIGIPADEISHIGSFGYRATNVRHRPTRGGGFGLTKAVTIVRKLGGTLSVASRIGTGTRVSVHVPLPGKTADPEIARIDAALGL